MDPEGILKEKDVHFLILLISNLIVSKGDNWSLFHGNKVVI